MNQSLYDKIYSFIDFLNLKSIFKPLYYKLYKNNLNDRIRENLHMNGLETLVKFHDCMESHHIPYTLAFGTMLGAVREHGFIKHDLDIDTFVWEDNYTPELRNYLSEAGFKLTDTFLVDDGHSGREETYEYKGVQIDIFFIYPPLRELPYCCDFLLGDCPSYMACMKKYGGAFPRRLEMPFKKGRKLVPFETVEFYIPENAEEILEFRYGKDYMTPNPEWGVQSHDDHIIPWEGKKGIYEEY